MTNKIFFHAPRALLAAGLFVGVAAAQAASGYTVNKDQEALVIVGMNKADVLQTLGRPAANVKFFNEPGPTFSYRLAGAEQLLFDVDFDASGKVASTSERIDQTGRGSPDHGGNR